MVEMKEVGQMWFKQREIDLGGMARVEQRKREEEGSNKNCRREQVEVSQK